MSPGWISSPRSPRKPPPAHWDGLAGQLQRLIPAHGDGRILSLMSDRTTGENKSKPLPPTDLPPEETLRKSAAQDAEVAEVSRGEQKMLSKGDVAADVEAAGARSGAETPDFRDGPCHTRRGAPEGDSSRAPASEVRGGFDDKFGIG